MSPRDRFEWSSVTDERIMEVMRQSATLSEALAALGGSSLGAMKNELTKRGLTKAARDARESNKESPDENEVSRQEETSNSFSYDAGADVYVFLIAGRPTPYVVPGEKWRAICNDYPDAGPGKTRGQLSIEYDVPRPILEKILRVYGLYKHDPDHAHELLQGASEEKIEELQKESLERTKHRYLVGLQRREIAEMRREVVELRRFKEDRRSAESRLEEAAERVMSRIGSAPAAVERISPIAGGLMEGEEFAAHAPISDLHVGKPAWSAETWGGNWDTKIACAANVFHGREVARFVSSLGGRCSELWSTNVGDYFNGLDLQTEAGTPQEQDDRAMKVWESAFEAEIVKIETLRQAAGVVRLRYVPGNHDHLHLQMFFHSLKQRYTGCDDVEVVWHPRWQECFRVARSLHVLDHGKGLPPNLNTPGAKAAATRVARNVGGEEFYASRFVFFYVGHLHEESRATEDNMRLYRLPAACDQSRYEVKGRYSAEPGARVWTLDAMGRPEIEKPIYLGEKDAA